MDKREKKLFILHVLYVVALVVAIILMAVLQKQIDSYNELVMDALGQAQDRIATLEEENLRLRNGYHVITTMYDYDGSIYKYMIHPLAPGEPENDYSKEGFFLFTTYDQFRKIRNLN